MIVPYQVDVPMRRWPIANFAIIGITAIIYFLEKSLSESFLLKLILIDWSPLGLIGYMGLHADLLHLIGNMIFLWVFGNAICAKMGNVFYPLAYVGLGMMSGIIHLVFDGRPAIGASGAINGIIGMFLVWYLLNSVTCFYWIFVVAGRFSISSYWMILLWLGFDIWGAFRSEEGIAVYAHLGGFAAGLVLAGALLILKWITMDPTERSLLDILSRKEPSSPKMYQPHRLFQGPAPSPAVVPKAPSNSAPPPDEFIRFFCPCGKSLKAPRKMAGKQSKCPSCSGDILVPSED